ncbi:hypothetical protein GCM10023116_38980 [Kistimonas scapharcae]|uniref:Pentapeptide repeat-containing protein n=1 Tax=Kistimonas scapharcae TaxID=1036133 RepID=A0ABP8V866_9GAMM
MAEEYFKKNEDGRWVLEGEDAIALWQQGADVWNAAVAKHPNATVDFESFDFYHKKGSISFAGFDFPTGTVSFSRAFFGDVSFRYANFGDGDVLFHKTGFLHGNVDFTGATFGSGQVHFLGAIFVIARGTPSTIYRSDPDTGSLSFIREAPCPQNVISGFSTSTPGK